MFFSSLCLSLRAFFFIFFFFCTSTRFIPALDAGVNDTVIPLFVVVVVVVVVVVGFIFCLVSSLHCPFLNHSNNFESSAVIKIKIIAKKRLVFNVAKTHSRGRGKTSV